MATAEPIDDLISNEPPADKDSAEPPEDRDVPPPVDEEDLEHRQLDDSEFWRDIPAFSDVDEDQFFDYMWQMRHAAYGKDDLIEKLQGLAPEEFIEDVRRGFDKAPMAVRITPYIFSRIDWETPWQDPLRLQFLPIASRLHPDHPMLTLDSLHEQKDAPVDGLTHRYPDKALFLVLDTCPVYCRFCTRSYAVGVDTDTVQKAELRVSPDRWEEAFEYIESRPELEDIVISGGDTYNLAAKHLKHLGERLLKIDHIRRIRYATKGLAVMPMKVLTDEDWLRAMKEVTELGRDLHKEVAIHTHFNHPNEITAISKRATDRLFEEGIKVRNQCVLQRDVNDSPETMKLLTKKLSGINVQPYYVYQHDMVQGVEDLRTSVQTNIEIEKAVRGVTAGFNTATHVVDAPGGGGKRDVHSYEHYNRETGVSVYTAPSVKPGEYFTYFDPLHSLDDDVREAWKDEDKRREMVEDALDEAKSGHEREHVGE
ncbi:MAG: KamA family radical SAM protein [Bradymonadaceae bacterium]